jgi:hypothetical protein
VLAPDREHVRGVATADVDEVVPEHEVAQIGRRPGEEIEVRDVGAVLEGVEDANEVLRVLGTRGRDEQDARPPLPREAEEPVLECAVVGRADLMAAESHYLRPGHSASIWEDSPPS